MDLNCEILIFENNKVVFYGSQTGTAEEFAGRLAKEGARFIFCKALRPIFKSLLSPRQVRTKRSGRRPRGGGDGRSSEAQ